MSSEPKNPEALSVRELFLEALDLPASARRVYLDRACEGDAARRQRVLELLAEHERLEGFMEGPASTAALAISEKPGDVIGRYKLIEQIGEGGTGVVYRAEQTHPVRREVALKILKAGMDTKTIVARFEAERQALAMMDHPNIAKVFDGGATENGRPFFVMELVRGVRVTDFCNDESLPTEERLKLFADVCSAIQHAHQKGIIHRDIKPSNILVTRGDHGPLPKVIDFGIAKATEQRLTERTLVTEFRSFIGTPAYMSPEQMEMSGGDVDTRSDIYSLGVLLYEMLTGHLPFAPSLLQSGIDEFRRVVRDEEPAAPSTRVSSLPAADLATAANLRRSDRRTFVAELRGELDWIVMKCLEKDRGRRYATANDLIADVQRFLAGEPILARPPSTVYRAGKFARRHRLAVSAATVAICSLVLASIVSIREAARARAAEQAANESRANAESQSRRAQANESRALLSEYVADMTLAEQALRAGNFGRAHHLLAKHSSGRGSELRGFEWSYLRRLAEGSPHQTVIAAGDQVRSVAFSPDGKRFAVGTSKSASVYDAASLRMIAASEGGAFNVLFAPDGERIFAADPFSVRLINARTGEIIYDTGEVGAPIALSLDGKFLAGNGGEATVICDAETLEILRELPRSGRPLAFSRDGSLATRNRFAAGITLWPVEAEAREISALEGRGRFGGFHQLATIFAFSADGSEMFAANDMAPLELNSKRSPAGEAHAAPISALALSGDGKIATASWDHTIKIWDAKTMELAATLQGHLNEAWTVAFSPDGKTLLSGAKDGGVFLWPLDEARGSDLIEGPLSPIFADESSLVALDRRSGEIKMLDAKTGAPRKTLFRAPAGFRPGPFGFGLPHASADLKTFARITREGLEVQRGQNSFTLALREEPAFIAGIASDGGELVITRPGRASEFWDLNTKTNFPISFRGDRAIFMSDATRVLLLSGANGAIWNTKEKRIERELKFDAPIGFAAALSPDDRVLAAGAAPDRSNDILLFDIRRGEKLGALSGHKQGIGGVAFSPDGKTLASSSADGALIFWNVATFQELFTLQTQNAESLIFSRDGDAFAFYTRGKSGEGIRILRADLPATAAVRPKTE